MWLKQEINLEPDERHRFRQLDIGREKDWHNERERETDWEKRRQRHTQTHLEDRETKKKRMTI